MSVLYFVLWILWAGSGKAKWTPIEIDPPKYERQNSRGGVTRVRGGGDIRSPRESPRFRRNGPVNNNQYNKGNDYSWYLIEARIFLALCSLFLLKSSNQHENALLFSYQKGYIFYLDCFGTFISSNDGSFQLCNLAWMIWTIICLADVSERDEGGPISPRSTDMKSPRSIDGNWRDRSNHSSSSNRGGHSNRRGGSRAGRGGRGRGGRSYHHNDSSQQGNGLEIHWNDFACSLGNSFFLFVNPQIMFLHYCQVCYPTDLTWACVFASLFTSLTRQLRNVQTIPDWIIPNNLLVDKAKIPL